MTKLLGKLAQDNLGASAVEYGLMLALIALVILVGAQLLGTSVLGLFTDPRLTAGS